MQMETSPLYRGRRRTNLIGLTLSMSAMVLGLIALFSILFVLFSNPLSSHALARAAHFAGISLGSRVKCDELAGYCDDEEDKA